MTKRDYQAIARAIYDTRTQDTDYASEARSAVAILTERLADIMAADNPRFDRARFVEACETGRCKGMPR